MDEDISYKTKQTSALYFEGIKEETPYSIWRSFDKKLAKDFSLFITGNLYSRGVVPHTVRQLITISALCVLGRSEELKLHIYVALNVGCTPNEICEVIFQTFTYAGIPLVNNALKIFREILKEKNLWPIEHN